MNMSLQKGTMFKGNVIWTNRQFLEAEDMVIFREIVFCFVAKVGLITPFITYTGYRSYWVWGPPCNNFHASLLLFNWFWDLPCSNSPPGDDSHHTQDAVGVWEARIVKNTWQVNQALFPEKNKARYEKPLFLRRGTLPGVGRWVPAMNFDEFWRVASDW